MSSESEMPDRSCPFCNSRPPFEQMDQGGKAFDVFDFDCRYCGRFTITGKYERTLPDLDTDDRELLLKSIKAKNTEGVTPHVDELCLQDARSAALAESRRH